MRVRKRDGQKKGLALRGTRNIENFLYRLIGRFFVNIKRKIAAAYPGLHHTVYIPEADLWTDII